LTVKKAFSSKILAFLIRVQSPTKETVSKKVEITFDFTQSDADTANTNFAPTLE
jgi:hypothetical protein